MFNRIRHSEILLNGIKLMSASSLSQLVAVLAYPFITRLYDPSSLGQLSLFLALVGLGSILASAQYENAIMIETDSRNAATVVDICFLLAIITSFLIFVISYSFFLFLGDDYCFLLLVAPLTLLSSTGWVYSFWCNRNNHFGHSAAYTAIQSLVSSGMKITLGLFHLQKWGLILATFVGQIVGLFSIIFYRPKKNAQLFQFSFNRMQILAHKHINFPKYTLLHRLLNTVVNNLPILVLPLAFDMADIGFFALAINVSLKPVLSFARLANQVLFHRIGRNHRNGIRSYRQLLLFFLKILRIAIPLLLIIYIILPHTTIFIFGDGWQKTGQLLQIILPWILASFLAQTLNFIPFVFSKQREAFIFEIIGTLLQCCILIFGLHLENLTLAITLLSCTNTIFYISQIWWYFYLLKNN